MDQRQNTLFIPRKIFPVRPKFFLSLRPLTCEFFVTVRDWPMNALSKKCPAKAKV